MFNNKTFAVQMFNAANNISRGLMGSNEEQINLFNGTCVRFQKTDKAECFDLNLFDSFTSEFIKTLTISLSDDCLKDIEMFETMLNEGL